MELLTVLLKSIVIGGLFGAGIGAGAARMFHAPSSQAAGAFRTLGEMNACGGDAASHFSFGLGFLFNAWASVVGAGALTQDVAHRVIPNWAAASLVRKDKPLADTMHNPKKMAISGAVIGAVVLAFLNSTAAAIPESLQAVAVLVLAPAADNLINLAMPIIFWLAALDAGKRPGVWGTIFGGVSHIVMGNATPGVVLGILIGKGIDDLGWNRGVKILLTAVIILFVLSAFFRGVDIQLIESFGLTVPNWLLNLHELIG